VTAVSAGSSLRMGIMNENVSTVGLPLRAFAGRVRIMMTVPRGLDGSNFRSLRSPPPAQHHHSGPM
jgi:hypothetical protein